MAVKIKLKRMGKIRTPQYRIIVADARTKRDGRAIEEIGKYHPLEEPSFIEVDSERAQHWLSVGAQPTTPVKNILKITGDWQQFKGLPAPSPMKVAEPKPDKEAEFQAVLKEMVLPENEGAGGPKTQAASGKAEAEAEKAEAETERAETEKAEKAEQTEGAGTAKSEGEA